MIADSFISFSAVQIPYDLSYIFSYIDTNSVCISIYQYLSHFLHICVTHSLTVFQGNEAFQPVQTSLAPGDLVQSAVVVSSTPGGTVFLEPQAVTLTELPGGTVQTLPAGSTFEGTVTAVNSQYSR